MEKEKIMNQSRVTSPKITAYLKEQCGWSRGIRSILNKYGLRFEEKQIHIPENYQEMVEKSRQSLQPTLLLDDLVLADISGDELESFLLSNKYVGSKLSQLDGIDSLLSIVQMPKGVPVATVAINNSKNAGLLAARIIGIENAAIREQLIELQKSTADEVDLKDLKLQGQ